MRKISKKAVGLILVIALCLSMIPIQAMAEDNEAIPEVTVSPTESPAASDAVQENPSPEPTPEPTVSETPNEQGGQTQTSEPPAIPERAGENADVNGEAASPSPSIPTNTGTDIEPVLFKTVDRPLVEIAYHYFDPAKNQEISSFEDYAVESSHTYYAGVTVSDSAILIAANKYPDKVAVSTEALRFRVVMDNSLDVTSAAGYDVGTGILSLPRNFTGHEIMVEWYCPASEVVELPVKVTISTNRRDQYEDTVQEIVLPSNASTVSILLSGVSGVSASQNDVDLPDGDYCLTDGTLTIHTSPLGGAVHVNAAGVFPQTRGRDKTTITSTRAENQIFYGYYTKYYWADGNQAFCLDPTVRGASNGEYAISRYLNKNGSAQDQLLTKISYYGFGGPAFDTVKQGLFGDSNDNDQMYALCHVAASFVYLNDEAAFKGLGQDMINHVKGMIASFDAQPMPPEGFDAFIYNEGRENGQQPIMGWDYTPTGNLEIVKISANPPVTNGNPCYSLEGAVFDVFDSGGQQIGTVTTDGNGKAGLEGIEAGTGFYIVERTAPKGFAKHLDRINFNIISGQTTTLEVKNIPQNDPIDILLKKQDADTNTAKPQGGAGLKDGRFTIRYYKGLYSTANELEAAVPERTWIVKTDGDGYALLHPDYIVSGDPLYYGSNGQIPTIFLGTITVQESTAPAGYLISNELYIRQIMSSGGGVEAVRTYNAPIVKESVIRGGVRVEKWDNGLDDNMAQGDGSLKNTMLEIINRSAGSVVVNGITYAPGAVVYTMKTDAAGVAATANNLLPYGKYEVRESVSGQPEGYLHEGILSRTFEIKENGKIVNLNTPTTTIKNDVIRGGVRVEKWDNEIGAQRPQGGGTLEGATLEIVNRSAASVLVQGKLYGIGEVVYTMRTDQTYSAQTPGNLLPYGTYECRESVPPSEGYLATGILSRMFTIRENGKIVELDTGSTAIRNNPIRGDIKGVKIADGDAGRLAGVPFRITSLTTGESHTVITDKNGQFDTSSSWNPHSQNTNRGETDHDGIWFGDPETINDDLGALLYDNYLIEELPCAANEDMELLSFDVSIYRHSTVVNLGTLTDDYMQKPEIFTTAMDEETMGSEAHASEETTIIDTVYYSGLSVGKEYTVKGILMDQATGEPLSADWEPITAETTFRALSVTGSVPMEFVFDSSAMQGKSVVVYESLEFEGKEIAAHQDIEDKGQTVSFTEPQIRTSAAGIAGEKELDVYSKNTVIDTVSYDNLIIGQTYTLTGVLMEQATGEPILINGEPLTAQTIFEAKEKSGTIQARFDVDATALKGKNVVVFEKLEYKGREIAAHEDIADKEQTITFKNPKIGTSAAGADGDKEIIPDKTTTIVDTVTYEGLAVGKAYTVRGVLMDRESGEPLFVGNEKVTAETKFVAEASGSVEVVFTLNAIHLQGKSVVVFEKLYCSDVMIASHEDIGDEGQTVAFKIPKIQTEAKAEDGNKVMPVAEITKIVDTISYENLAVGEEYTVKGILMDKETNTPILNDGKQITAETTFVAETSGSVEVTFTFNSKPFQDRLIVVFESLEYQNREIAAHADINDDAQTVGVGIEVLPVTGKGAKTGRDGLSIWLLVTGIGAATVAMILIVRRKKKAS